MGKSMQSSSQPAHTNALWKLAPKPHLTGIVSYTDALITLLSQNLPGPRIIKLAWVVNLQKGLTGFYVLFLMCVMNNFSPAAFSYLSLHGTYGVLWILKDMIFPDPRWQVMISPLSAFASAASVLIPYWVPAYLLLAGVAPTPTPAMACFATAIHTIGVTIMFGADIQKAYTLKYRPGLISEGLFETTRNPNYLGEMMLYAAYACLSWHWVSWSILLYVWSVLFTTNMMVKEASLKRKDGWIEYSRKSWLLLPKLFSSSLVSTIFYVWLSIGLWILYKKVLSPFNV
eukprot:GILI01012263.1.p1 GENE.GILI01012263.1~~GILI01012263.1.p1  ORF type:complete len:305 (+),score=82.62 GILI01012263.1:60-917(+)